MTGSKSTGAPGLPTQELLETASDALWPNYRQYPVVFTRGEGSRLWDSEGREYLDFVAGIATCNLGHCHPAVTEAIRQQAAKLVHVSNWYYSDTTEVVFKLASLGLRRLASTYTRPEQGNVVETLKLFSNMLIRSPASRASIALKAHERPRLAQLRDPTVRKRMQEEFDGPEARAFPIQWETLEVESVRDDARAHLVGRTVAEVAAERGAEPLDTFLDVSLEDDLETWWTRRRAPDPRRRLRE